MIKVEKKKGKREGERKGVREKKKEGRAKNFFGFRVQFICLCKNFNYLEFNFVLKNQFMIIEFKRGI